MLPDHLKPIATLELPMTGDRRCASVKEMPFAAGYLRQPHNLGTALLPGVPECFAYAEE